MKPIAKAQKKVETQRTLIATWSGKEYCEADVKGGIAIHKKISTITHAPDPSAKLYSMSHAESGWSVCHKALSKKSAIELREKLLKLGSWRGWTEKDMPDNIKFSAGRIIRDHVGIK